MAVQMARRDVGTVTILDIRGKLVGDASDTLVGQIGDLLRDGRKHLVLNLGEVSFVDSEMLGTLLAQSSAVRAEGGALKLLNVGVRISDLLVTTRLEMTFDTFESEAEAVKSFDG